MASSASREWVAGHARSTASSACGSRASCSRRACARSPRGRRAPDGRSRRSRSATRRRMKQVLDDAGVRTPRHARARTQAGVPGEAAERDRLPAHHQAHQPAPARRTRTGCEEPGDLAQALDAARPRATRSASRSTSRARSTPTTRSAPNGQRPCSRTSPGTGPSRWSCARTPWISPQAICLREHRPRPEVADRASPWDYAVREALGFQHRLHAYGVVPAADRRRRRGGVRRDRRALAGGAAGARA